MVLIATLSVTDDLGLDQRLLSPLRLLHAVRPACLAYVIRTES
jgi:hypothetical protein